MNNNNLTERTRAYLANESKWNESNTAEVAR